MTTHEPCKSEGRAGWCSFAAAVLKGLIEHDDASAYFGSTMALSHWIGKAYELRWIEQDFERAWCVTENGRLHYEQSGLREIGTDGEAGCKPQWGRRAYSWDWTKYAGYDKRYEHHYRSVGETVDGSRWIRCRDCGLTIELDAFSLREDSLLKLQRVQYCCTGARDEKDEIEVKP